MFMKKNKHLRIRITEDQMKRLIDKIVVEESNKSKLIRDLINEYLDKNVVK